MKTRTIQLIAIDIDGTLLNSAGEVDPRNREAIQRAVSQGVRIVLATGRMRRGVVRFSEEIGLRDYAISLNGARVFDPEGVAIMHHALPDDVFRLVRDYARKHSVHLSAYANDELLVSGDSEWGREYVRRLRAGPPPRPDLSVTPEGLSKVLLVDDPARIPLHRAALEPEAAARGGRVTESSPDYLEFLAEGVSKGTALQWLCNRLGISQSATAAIGDFQNDVEMVRWAGLGGAVADAHPDLAAVADITVSSHDDAGVAEFIEIALGA
jgi:Cof subfamily protein (haloacid dehalogenase superfamily)